MSKIKLPHASGNSVSIAAPESNPASDRTLYVPSNANGTILTTTSPKAGNILQVKQTYKSDTFTSESATFVDVTGLQCSITPTSSSSKILITANVHTAAESWQYGSVAFKIVYASDNTNYADIALPTGTASTIGHMSQQLYSNGASNTEHNHSHLSWSYLHSPSTTNEIGYKVQGRLQLAGSWWVNRSAAAYYATSSITLMEVAG